MSVSIQACELHNNTLKLMRNSLIIRNGFKDLTAISARMWILNVNTFSSVTKTRTKIKYVNFEISRTCVYLYSINYELVQCLLLKEHVIDHWADSKNNSNKHIDWIKSIHEENRHITIRSMESYNDTGRKLLRWTPVEHSRRVELTRIWQCIGMRVNLTWSNIVVITRL